MIKRLVFFNVLDVILFISCYNISTFGRSGETGIHARLKILCSQQAWGFDSLLRHTRVYKVHKVESYKVGDLYKINGDWRNWLACMVWDHEVAGSNPVSPTRQKFISFIFRRVNHNARSALG